MKKEVINIKESWSNKTIKCIVFTNNYDVGHIKLLEIEKEKNNIGILTVRKSQYDINFSNGEVWSVLKPNNVNAIRLYKWQKAWVDVKVSIEQLQMLIISANNTYYLDNVKYFNWNEY